MRGSLCLLFLLVTLSAPGREASAQAPREQQWVGELNVNGVAQGEAFVLVIDDALFLEKAAIDRAKIALETLNVVTREEAGQTFVSLKELRPAIESRIDLSTGLISLTVDPTLLPYTQIDMRGFGTDRPTVEHNTSFFLNYSATYQSAALSTSLEPGVNAFGAFFTSTMTWSPEDGVPLRGLSHAIYDFPKLMSRLTVGDKLAISGRLGGASVLGGVHFNRQFELDPYFVSRPMLTLDGDVTTPSTVDVYVNGQRVRQQNLSPGRFSLQNLTLPDGATDARYVIRDAFGRERQYLVSRYISSGLLSKGVTDYGFSLGAQRNMFSRELLSYAGPASNAYYRRGFSSFITAGLRAEANLDMVNAGPGLVFAMPLGEIDVALSGSVGQRRQGGAASAVYSLQYRSWVLGLFTQAQSAQYTHLDQLIGADRALYEGGTSLTVALGTRASVGGQVSAQRYRDIGDGLRSSVQARFQGTPWLMFSLSGVAVQTERAQPFYTVTAGVNMLLDALTVVTVNRSNARNGATDFDAHRAMLPGGGLGYSAQGRVGDNGQMQFRGRGDYAASFGRFSAGAEWYDGRLSPTGQVAGALVGIDKSLFISRPVDQGFALVRVPGVSNARVLFNNQEIGRTDKSGDFLAWGQLPYQANRISVSDQDLPSDQYLGEISRVYAPSFRGGAIIRFQPRRLAAVRGSLSVVMGEERVRLRYGTLTLRDDAGTVISESPLGREGDFELKDLEDRVYVAEARSGGKTCRLTFDAPVVSGLVDMGDLTCVER